MCVPGDLGSDKIEILEVAEVSKSGLREEVFGAVYESEKVNRKDGQHAKLIAHLDGMQSAGYQIICQLTPPVIYIFIECSEFKAVCGEKSKHRRENRTINLCRVLWD